LPASFIQKSDLSVVTLPQKGDGHRQVGGVSVLQWFKLSNNYASRGFPGASPPAELGARSYPDRSTAALLIYFWSEMSLTLTADWLV
jgi:hypothetical protein